jgi:phosphate acetyltransferase
VANSVFIAAAAPDSGKSAVALGLYDHVLRRSPRVGVFRPVVRAGGEPDPLIHLLRSRGGADIPYEECVGVTYDEVHANPERALADIVPRFRALSAQCDAVVVVGTDYSDVGSATELIFNARIATNLGSPVVFVLNGQGKSVDGVRTAVELARSTLAEEHAQLLHVVVNRADPGQVDAIRERLTGSSVPVDVVPETESLSAPTVAQLAAAAEARLINGDAALLGRDAKDIVVAAMTLPHVLDHLSEGCVVITPGDRSDVLLGMLMAHRAETYPPLAGIVLTGGFEPDQQVQRLVEGRASRLPLLLTDLDTFETAARLSTTRGRIAAESDTKIDAALDLVSEHVRLSAIVDSTLGHAARIVTPIVFEYDLIDRARRERRHVVLPEGSEPRILQAAETVLRRGIADLTLLGEELAIRALAGDLGVDISTAKILNPQDEQVREEFAAEYATLRKHKGMTVDAARDIVVDVSYFGTMMVHLGMADGMVSGAVHTTAHTIRPSFEIIKTKPGVGIVSSVFFMALEDRVLVYGDCAVNPNPNAEQLADIAISSAETAAQFGVEPRVAMLSYSTGTSGSGAEVEKVRQATEIARERRPDLSIEGPIQYDAAVDASVAKTKLPDSAVAGRATVFIFPDLNTGNNTYKAVQRSAGAVAIGPVLQGLNKPVNDLSRGALVEDIVNTVAITAIQAQGAEGASA